MKREFKVDANVGRPQVAYRETVRRRVEEVEGKFIRQTGGRGQYGHVVINMEPGEPGTGFVFEDNIEHEAGARRSEEHTSELQSLAYLVCRLLLEKKKINKPNAQVPIALL